MINKSKVYFDGSKWKTNDYGEIEVIGRSDRVVIKKNKYTEHPYFFVRFKDGTVVEANQSSIKNGSLKNRNEPRVYGFGYVGYGKHKAYVNGKDAKEYKLWIRILERCYSEKWHIKKPTYKNCRVHPDWHNFQVFSEDIKKIDGYDKWKNDKSKINKYQIDKDIKFPGNKIYSKETCCFVTQRENSSESNKRNRITGLTYIGIRESDGYSEFFLNQAEFARKYNLEKSSVGRCCRKEQLTHKGWIFKIK